MSTPSQYEYESNEAALYRKQIAEIEKAPLSERKEACADFYKAMKDNPALVAEHIGWLLDGNYGYGAMQVARRVAHAGGRTNKSSHLGPMIAALDWQCPARMAVAAWKKLSPSEKATLESAIKAEIKSYLEGAE
jgi:hypothetical protein